MSGSGRVAWLRRAGGGQQIRNRNKSNRANALRACTEDLPPCALTCPGSRGRTWAAAGPPGPAAAYLASCPWRWDLYAPLRRRAVLRLFRARGASPGHTSFGRCSHRCDHRAATSVGTRSRRAASAPSRTGYPRPCETLAAFRELSTSNCPPRATICSRSEQARR